MKIGQNNNINFGATFRYGVGNLASESVKNGMSKKYVQGIIKKVNNLFPEKEYFIHYYDYAMLDKPRMTCCQITIERKNPKDWDPNKSIYKCALWPKFKEDRKNFIVDNELIAFYNGIRELAKRDFSFKPSNKTEKIWLA